MWCSSRHKGTQRNLSQGWFQYGHQGCSTDKRKLLADRYQWKMALSIESWNFDSASTPHIDANGRKFFPYTRSVKKDKREVYVFAWRAASNAIEQGDVRLRIQLPGGHYHMTAAMVRDVLHVEGAHNLRSQSGLMDTGLQIISMNGFRIEIHNNSHTGGGGQVTPVAAAPHVGGQFWFHVDVAGECHQSTDAVSRCNTWWPANNARTGEHGYTYIVEPEEPTNEWESSARNVLASTINWPAACCGSGGTTAGQLKDRVGSSNENDDENESEVEDKEDPPAVINKSKISCILQELAGLVRNLRSVWEAPAGIPQSRSWTDHRHWSSGQHETQSAEADWPVQAEPLDHAVVELESLILSFLRWINALKELWIWVIALEELGTVTIFKFSLWYSDSFMIPTRRRVGKSLRVVITCC